MIMYKGYSLVESADGIVAVWKGFELLVLSQSINAARQWIREQEKTK
jgi:hypothetical protein